MYIWALPILQFDPPITQIRALCGTITLPKIRKFFKHQFWLWEWIFWQWLRSNMILRWYSDGNEGKYCWNWWKSSGSVMVYIHWRTATNNLGKRFDPPPFLGNAQMYTIFWVGLPLKVLWNCKILNVLPLFPAVLGQSSAIARILEPTFYESQFLKKRMSCHLIMHNHALCIYIMSHAFKLLFFAVQGQRA